MVGLSGRELVVMSGGLDSTTLAYNLCSEGKHICGIYFDIGYRPRVAERNSARLAAHRLGIPLEVVNIPGIFDLVTGFYPTDSVGAGELDKGQPTPIPIADGVRYVVGFHVIVSLATYYAQLADIRQIHVGLTKEQFDFTAGLGDFARSWSNAVGPLNPTIPFTLGTPFKTMSKSEIVDLGAKLEVPFEDTWSCLNSFPVHCGKCSGCLSRKQAFEGSRTKDPTTYQV